MRAISVLFEVEGFHKRALSFTLSPNSGGPGFFVSGVGGKVAERQEKTPSCRSTFGQLSGLTWMTLSSHFTSLSLCVGITVTGTFLVDSLGQ